MRGCGQQSPQYDTKRAVAVLTDRDTDVRDTDCFRRCPAGLDTAAAFQPVEGGIERSLLDAQYLARNLMDAFGDGQAIVQLEDEPLCVGIVTYMLLD